MEENDHNFPSLMYNAVPLLEEQKHTNTGTYEHSHTPTFQEDMSDDIFSDSASPTWFCGDGVKHRAVPACLNSLWHHEESED